MSEQWCGNCAPDIPGKHIRLDEKGKCVDCGQQILPRAITLRELRHIDTIEDLDCQCETFFSGLSANEQVKAILRVKYREAVTWIQANLERNGWII